MDYEFNLAFRDRVESIKVLDNIDNMDNTKKVVIPELQNKIVQKLNNTINERIRKNIFVSSISS